MSRIAPFLTLVGILFTTPALAQNADLYNCKFNVRSGDWLVPEVFVVAPDGNDNIYVADAFILSEVEEPLTAKVRRNDAKWLNLTWEVRARDSRGNMARMQFNLSINQKTKRASVSSKPLGYPNKWRAQGKCPVRRGNF